MKIYFVWAGNKLFREVDLDFNASVGLEETVVQPKVNELEKGEETKLAAFGGASAYDQCQQWTARCEVWSTWGCCQIFVKLRQWYTVLMKSREGEPPCVQQQLPLTVICTGTGRGQSFQSRGQNLSICTGLKV